MRGLVVVLALEALLLAVVVVVYIERESSPTTFPTAVTMSGSPATRSAVAVSFPTGIVGRTKQVAPARGGHATSTSRDSGRSSAPQP